MNNPGYPTPHPAAAILNQLLQGPAHAALQHAQQAPQFFTYKHDALASMAPDMRGGSLAFQPGRGYYIAYNAPRQVQQVQPVFNPVATHQPVVPDEARYGYDAGNLNLAPAAGAVDPRAALLRLLGMDG